MSDPVSNIDIEDVLTSIRRLVREGGGGDDQKSVVMGPGADRTGLGQPDAALSSRTGLVPASVAHPSATRSHVTQTNSENAPARFVLTPALRVLDAPRAPNLRVADAPPLPPAKRMADVPRPPEEAITTSSHRLLPLADDVPLPQDILAHVDVLRALADHSTRPLEAFDFASVLKRPTDDVANGGPGDPDGSATPDVVPDPDQADGTQVDAPGTDTQGDFRLRLSDTAAGLEAAVTAQLDDWEPDGSEGVPVMDWSRAVPEDAPVFRSRHAAQSVALPEIPTFRHRDRDDHVPDHSKDHQDIAGVAAPDAAAAAEGSRSRPNPDAEHQADVSPGLDIEDDIAAYLGRDNMMNEGALRALIVEIVRQELQGSLGERITRNVRKLVRREISRMLSSEEFD